MPAGPAGRRRWPRESGAAAPPDGWRLALSSSDPSASVPDTIVVAPLEPKGSGTFADRLNPEVEIDGQAFVLITQEIVTVRKSVLGASRASIAKDREKVIAALDLLFTGF